MKLSCALVLALTNLVIATPFSFSVKGSGSPGKVNPTTIPFGTFGIVQPIESKTGYSGSISKSSSSSFASSSASQSSGSFNYNSAQAGGPSLASNAAGFVAPSQSVGQNVAVTPQTFASAAPNIHHVGFSVNPTVAGYSPSQDVNGASPHADTVSQFQHQVVTSEQKPDLYWGSNPHVSVSQDTSKPNVFVSTLPSANAAVSGSSYSKDVYGVQANSDTVTKFQHQVPTEQQNGIYLGVNSNAPESQGISQSHVSFVSTESPAILSVSSSQSPKDVNGAQISADTTSSYPHGLVQKDQKPDFYLGSDPHTFVSQDIVKPNVLSSGDSREPERFNEPSTIQNIPSNIVSTVQGQAAPTVEKKPTYSSGFGGPPGVFKPYDKVSVSSVTNQASNSYQSNQKPSESVNTKPQVVSYTPVNNDNPSYSFQQQQQQTVTIKPVGQSLNIDNVTPSSQYSYRPEIIPSETNKNKPSYVKDNERPSSEFRPTNNVQITGDKYVNQKPEIESSQNTEFDVQHASHNIKPNYHIIVQAQPGKKPSQAGIQYDTSYVTTESAEKLKPTQEPLYTGGFGAPAGILEPIQGSLSEVHKFASTTVKPEWQDSTKPNVGFTATETEVYKQSSSFGETNPTQKPSFESTTYQSFDIGSSPASYVTYKPPSSSSSYSEQYIQTSSISEGQSTPKPFESIPAKPTLSTWTQNPTQAPTYVQKPETINPPKPVVEISSQNKPTIQDSQFVGTYTTTKPHSQYEKFPSSPLPWGYSSSDVSGPVEEAKPNNQLVSSIQNKPSQSGNIAGQIEVQKPFYQPYQTGKPTVNQVSFDKTKPSGSVVLTGYKETATNVQSGSAYQINDKETTSKVSESNSFSGNAEPQSPKKPTVINQNKPYLTSFGTLTGSTGYISSTSNLGQSGFATESNDKVSQTSQSLSTDLHKPTPSSYVVPSNVGTETPSVKPGVTSGSTVISQQSSFGGLNRVSSANTSPSQKPTYQPLSDSYSVTGSVSQNSNIQKHTDKSSSVQEKPSSEQQKYPNQVFTSNSPFSSGFTTFVSKPQYQQQPTVQPAAQKKPWYTNTFGTSVTAKPYNQYPGFSSSFTSFGYGSSVTPGSFEKTKQTTQFISTGQYTPTSSGQYKPYSTGQYKPYNWGVGVQQGVKKFSNVYPTGGYFASTYAPTTFKPFVKPSSFDKSKDSNSFSVTSNKESTYVSGVGSPLSVTTSKPSSFSQTTYKPISGFSSSGGYSENSNSFSVTSNKESTYVSGVGSPLSVTTSKPSSFSQTTYKPISGFSSSGGYSENPTISTTVVSTTPKYETPKNQLGEPRPNESSHSTQNSGFSTSAQSSFSSVKPTIALPTHSAQFDVNSEKVNPTTVSPSGSVGYHPNESGFKVEVTKVSESSYTLAPETGKSPVSENKPYSDIYVQSVGTKPSTTFTSQNKIDEKVQFSQTSKPTSSYDLIKEIPTFDGHFEGASDGLKPTNQPFISTSAYYFNKEVTPTQVSAISQNKADQVQFSQTYKPDWSSGSNQKESSFVSSFEKTSDDIKPTGQPTLSTGSYSYNKEVTSAQLDAKNPSNYGTFTKHTSASLTTGSTGFSNFGSSQKQPTQSVLSSTYLGDSKEHPSSLVPNKPEYSTTVQQPSGQVPFISGFVSGLVDSPKENKPFTASHNTQYNSAGSYQSTSEHFVSAKPSQVPAFEKESGFVVSYKEKDTNQASFISSHAKPTATFVETDSKYTYGPTQVPQSEQTPAVSSVSESQKPNQVYPTSQANVAYNVGSVGLYDSSKQSNQQSWGFSGNNGAPQSTQASYVGGFGGPTGILKPSEFSKPPQQQYVQTQYKPTYNNQATWESQRNPQTTVTSNTASYTGGFGAPAGVLTANENVKPNSYVHNVDKTVSNVQVSGFHAHPGQTGVSQAQQLSGRYSRSTDVNKVTLVG